MTAAETYAIPLQLDALVSEVERYLAAVELFRSEGCEPRWSSGESLPSAALPDLLSPWPEPVHA